MESAFPGEGDVLIKLEVRERGEKESKYRSNGLSAFPYSPPHPRLKIHDSNVKNNQKILAQAEGKNNLERKP